MIRYKEFKPSDFDRAGLGLPERQEWWLLPCTRNRDSDLLEESNFDTALSKLGGESETVEVHSFNHWACGWFEIILVAPDSDEYQIAQTLIEKLNNYPVLDEDDYTERLQKEASRFWKSCFSPKERLAYIRKHLDQFHGLSWEDLLANVRGLIFSGSVSELIEG